jgi:hypothetical protein
MVVKRSNTNLVVLFHKMDGKKKNIYIVFSILKVKHRYSYYNLCIYQFHIFFLFLFEKEKRYLYQNLCQCGLFFFLLKLKLFFLLPFLFGFRVGGEHQSKELHIDWLVSFLGMMVMTITLQS